MATHRFVVSARLYKVVRKYRPFSWRYVTVEHMLESLDVVDVFGKAALVSVGINIVSDVPLNMIRSRVGRHSIAYRGSLPGEPYTPPKH